MKVLSNAKGAKSDSLAVRLELQARGLMKNLHPKPTGQFDANGNPKLTYARAPWVWTPAEFKSVLEVMKGIRAPTNYGSSLSYKIGEKTMVGLKTHDWHNILHDILPIAIRGTLTPGIRETVYRLSWYFKKVCAKEFRMAELDDLVVEAAELAVYMEMNLPPNFFDIQPHHILHLPEELKMAGPVRPHWMYFIERYMKVLKDWVRQKARPESSIAEGYLTHEGMKFASEFVPGIDPTWASPWIGAGNEYIVEEKLPNAYTSKIRDAVFMGQAHKFILINHPSMTLWVQKYSEVQASTSEVLPYELWVRGAVVAELSNGGSISQEVLDITAGPSEKVDLFSG